MMDRLLLKNCAKFFFLFFSYNKNKNLFLKFYLFSYECIGKVHEGFRTLEYLKKNFKTDFYSRPIIPMNILKKGVIEL